MQYGRRLERFLTSGVVVIFEDNDVAAGECLDTLFSPLAGGDGGGTQLELSNMISVLFAFRYKNHGVGKLEQIGPAVQHAAIIKLPYPFAVTVGPTLPKVFWLIAQYLVQQGTVRVGV